MVEEQDKSLDPSKGKQLDKEKSVVDLFREQTLDSVMEVLHASEEEMVVIDGIEVIDPGAAFKKLKKCLDDLKEHFSIDKEKISLVQLPGNIVGKSTEEGIYIDPVMLMHPALRLTMAHELAHAKNKVINEELVESYVEYLVGKEGAELPREFENSIGIFREFAKNFDLNRDIESNVKKIYALYYTGDFDRIFSQYEEFGGTRDEFLEVFPELSYVEG